jgi:thiol-disulfide isomerase/thioredoxin
LAICQDAQADIKAEMDNHPDVPHVKVEDGKGRRLGRTFGVKLWPTLFFLKDGEEIARVVRPENSSDIEDALLKNSLRPAPAIAGVPGTIRKLENKSVPVFSCI